MWEHTVERGGREEGGREGEREREGGRDGGRREGEREGRREGGEEGIGYPFNYCTRQDRDKLTHCVVLRLWLM